MLSNAFEAYDFSRVYFVVALSVCAVICRAALDVAVSGLAEGVFVVQVGLFWLYWGFVGIHAAPL
jgi:predicted cobalt transporter CbtA